MDIINKFKIQHIWQIGCLILVFLLSSRVAISQNAGTLFMLPDNFRAQMLNPSCFSDEAILALPGLAGASIINDGNFKMTDFVYTKSSGQTVYDLGRFSEKGNPVNLNSVRLSLPLLYVGIPVENGMFSFYIKEKVNTAIRFPINTITWFANGNLPEEYRNFRSGNINFRMLSYHEFGFGYARRLNDKMRFGIRGKLLFGEVFAKVNDWNYRVETSADGDQVKLSSAGTGQLSLPFPLVLDNAGQIQNIETQNALSGYLSPRNPGFAIDGGVTIDIDEKREFSASVTDLGFIYFKKNTWDLVQNDTYVFRGIDISNAANRRLGNGYVFPFDLMINIRDSLQSVYKPFANPKNLVRGPAPQTFLHYRYQYSGSLSFGITNQTVFQKSYVMNTLSLNVLKYWRSFSFVGDVSLHRLSALTVGGGLQWDISFAQLFVFTDNIPAFYHPAAQKSYAVTFGLNFLLKRNENNVAGRNNSRRGKISKYFPFYRKYH